ncbi:hypothetical protein ACJA3J_05590 [Halobacillus sp. SY10]
MNETVEKVITELSNYIIDIRNGNCSSEELQLLPELVSSLAKLNSSNL